LIKGYTEKQWGRRCEELPPFIISRLPVRLTFDNNYFSDLYQGVPLNGYNELIKQMLSGIECQTETDYFKDREHWHSIAEKVVFTGAIDEFYDYCYGRLEYRTVRFETEILEQPNYQGNAVVNYTSSDVPYTRIIEHKHFELFGDDVYSNPVTVISKEYSSEWKPGMEPFYAVNDNRNQRVYKRYRELVLQEKTVIFGGRLAEYKYYDMAPVIRKAMDDFADYEKE